MDVGDNTNHKPNSKQKYLSYYNSSFSVTDISTFKFGLSMIELRKFDLLF